MAKLVRSILVMASSLFLLTAGYYYLPEAVVSWKEGEKSRIEPVYHINTEDNRTVLTFDLNWEAAPIRDLLELLEEKQVHAVFFVTGIWAQQYPEEIKAIAQAGHELGNHSESHQDMRALDKAACKEELLAVHERVKELTGKEMTLFRPPYGNYDEKLLATAQECGYTTVLWSIDAQDWKGGNSQKTITQIEENLNRDKSAIVLFRAGTKGILEIIDKLEL